MRTRTPAVGRRLSLAVAAGAVAVVVAAGAVPALAATVTGSAAPAAPAVFVPPTSTQFDIDGFLQSATVDTPGDAHSGGTLRVNGQRVVVPAETIVILPANALTWQELFAGAPAPYRPTQTGMATNDVPSPAYTYEIHVVGNRVGDTYIAGLIDIAQSGLGGGAGYINDINYATGEIRVGGVIGNANSGARVQLNDPGGRFGRAVSADPRFTVDADNPTVAAATGFPMCIPRTDPAVADDARCPQANRPGDGAGGYAIAIQMNDPTNPALGFPDARVQAPFEIGDYVTFNGSVVNDAAGSYVSAYSLINNAAIYTWPGTSPAYVTTEVTIMGTGGLTVIGAGEAAVRTRFEGMTTDPSRGIHLYGIDVNPVTGATTDRDWGTIGVDGGPAANGAVKGRWRFRPPCLAFGSVPTKVDKQCVYGPDGIFLPPTREMRAVVEGLQGQDPANPTAVTFANGIYAGQYHAPILEYIFPENVPGSPIVPNNFEAFPFLACGGYMSAGGTLAGQLNPWPGATAPKCVVAPTASAGGPYTVNSGDTVTLAGTATGSSPLAYSWATVSAGSLSDRQIAGPVFTAPRVSVSTTVNLSLTVTNGAGTSTDTSTITVSPASAPVVDPIADVAIDSGANGTIAVTGSDPNVPAHLPLTFHVAQSGTPALQGLTVAANGGSAANITFRAATGQATQSTVTLSVTATNAGGVDSAPVTVTVTVNPAQASCTPPVASAGGPYTVNAGSTVILAGSATGTTPITYAWTAASGSLSDASLANPVFTAPAVTVDTPVGVTLTAANGCGGNTASATITVKAARPPTVAHTTAITVFSGANGTFTVAGSDPNNPAQLPLTFAVTQTGAPALLNVVTTQHPPTGATVTFTAPTLAPGTVVPVVINLSIKATNALGQQSAADLTTVTVKPLPDQVAITSTEYRTGKQRLILTATSSVISTNVILTLNPYVTTTGSTFTPPDGTFTNGGGGLYTITLVGVPQPAAGNSLTVRSNLNGVSPAHALDRVRA